MIFACSFQPSHSINVDEPFPRLDFSRFNVSITAYALGEIFNEPWNPTAMAENPSDMLEFTVEAGGTLTHRGGRNKGRQKQVYLKFISKHLK